MSARASAARYARALLDVAIKENGNPEQVEQELASLADVVTSHPELQRALTNPAVPVSGKRGVMRELASRVKVSTPVDEADAAAGRSRSPGPAAGPRGGLPRAPDGSPAGRAGGGHDGRAAAAGPRRAAGEAARRGDRPARHDDGQRGSRRSSAASSPGSAARSTTAASPRISRDNEAAADEQRLRRAQAAQAPR